MRILEEIKEENQRLKQQLNLSLYKSDSLEQYGRRENLRIYIVPESTNKKDDGEDIIIEIAKLLNVNLKDLDIQRAHRLGQKRIGKTRPIIVRLVSFKKRLELLKLKKKLKTITTDVKNEDPSITKFKNAFITEDLTSLRAKLLRYVKEECDGRFAKVHTINGKIIRKETSDENDDNDKSDENGNAMSLKIETPDDLHRYGVDIDFLKLNYRPLCVINYSVTES